MCRPEYWIPADELALFNTRIVGPVAVTLSCIGAAIGEVRALAGEYGA